MDVQISVLKKRGPTVMKNIFFIRAILIMTLLSGSRVWAEFPRERMPEHIYESPKQTSRPETSAKPMEKPAALTVPKGFEATVKRPVESITPKPTIGYEAPLESEKKQAQPYIEATQNIPHPLDVREKAAAQEITKEKTAKFLPIGIGKEVPKLVAPPQAPGSEHGPKIPSGPATEAPKFTPIDKGVSLSTPEPSVHEKAFSEFVQDVTTKATQKNTAAPAGTPQAPGESLEAPKSEAKLLEPVFEVAKPTNVSVPSVPVELPTELIRLPEESTSQIKPIETKPVTPEEIGLSEERGVGPSKPEEPGVGQSTKVVSEVAQPKTEPAKMHEPPSKPLPAIPDRAAKTKPDGTVARTVVSQEPEQKPQTQKTSSQTKETPTTLKTKITTLDSQIKEAQTEALKTMNKSNKAAQEKEICKAAYEKIKKELATLDPKSETAKTAEERLAEANAKLKKATNNENQVQVELGDANQKLETLGSTRLDTLTKSYEMTKSQIAKGNVEAAGDLPKQITDIHQELTTKEVTLEGKIGAGEIKLKPIQIAIDALKKGLVTDPVNKELQNELKTKTQELSDTNSKITAAKTELDSTTKKLNTLLEGKKPQDLINEANQSVKTATTKLKETNKQIAAQEKINKKMAKTLSKLKSDIKKYSGQLESSTLTESKKQALTKKINDLNEKLKTSFEKQANEVKKLSNITAKKIGLEETQKEGIAAASYWAPHGNK